ncbi:HAD-superfamily hydrolase, subfamily IA, variant 3 [Candidatus Vecturithrix granuli]|uniref:HAD-superfamily hydrolase, subfamily IA, variant 3 n=1 Tax=Vecturithrix granuli TaxID=1499967 RepID=A0A081BZU3_VECG1|nr:HAD-superfamily hydrolase, subfamily IA, variant 3 [Candidatus Vecturithrix granuli]
MISTIFFDIGNVLVGFDHNRIWQRLADFSPYSPQEIQQLIQKTRLMPLHETGKLSPQQLFHAFQQHVQLDAALSYQRFSLLWADIFWENPPMIELAEQLRARYTLGLLSNTGEIHWNWLVSRFAIFRRIDLRILSFQVGCMKPDPQIFHEAIRQAHVQPEQCAYLDDIPTYIEASRKIGMHGIHVQSPEQVREECRALRIAL